MLSNLPTVADLLLSYSYWFLFVGVVFEGPIITFIAGSFAAVGHLNIYLIYLVVVAADLTGDGLHYALGRFGRHGFFLRMREKMGATPGRIEYIEKKFSQSDWKIFLSGKIAHGVGGLILISAGFAGYPFKKFITINFLITLVKSLVIVLLGYWFGNVLSFSNYLDWVAAGSIAIIVILGWRLTSQLSRIE